MKYTTWLHLSDLHACDQKTGWDSERVIPPLIQDLEQMEKEYQLQPDLIFFTGDAAFGSIPDSDIKQQFATATNFLEKVRLSFKNPPAKENVFVIPGNHDVDRNEVTEDQNSWLSQQKDASVIDRLIQKGGKQFENYMDRLAAFASFVREAGYAQFSDPKRLISAATRKIAGKTIGVASLNTAWSCSRDLERGALWMGGNWQIGEIKKQLGQTDINIALTHHPFGWLTEFEDPRLRQLMEREFNFHLHGHEHQGWVDVSTDGHVRIAAAACYESSSMENGYNFTRLNLQTGKIEMWLRRYESNGGGWVPKVIAKKTDNNGFRNFGPLPWLEKSKPEPIKTAPKEIHIKVVSTESKVVKALNSVPLAEDEPKTIFFHFKPEEVGKGLVDASVKPHLILFVFDDISAASKAQFDIDKQMLLALGLCIGKFGTSNIVALASGEISATLASNGISTITFPATKQASTLLQELKDFYNKKGDSANDSDVYTVNINYTPLPIYRDPRSYRDWFSTMRSVCEQPVAYLDSSMVYYGPGLAWFWTRLCQEHKAQSELQNAFEKINEELLANLKSDAVNVIDLGIGDFDKGQIVLEHYLKGGAQSINYFPLDISYSMLDLALNTNDETDAAQILRRVLKKGNIVAINASIDQLHRYTHLFPKNHQNVLLLFGNTLGNQLDEMQTLEDIGKAMGPNDLLVTELQLIEDKPKTEKEITEGVQNLKYFYAGPFTALGYPEDKIELTVQQQTGSPGSSDPITFEFWCNLKERRLITHGAFKEPWYLGKKKVCVYLVRKYDERSIATMFESAGFNVIKNKTYSVNPKDPKSRKVAYITAQKTKKTE